MSSAVVSTSAALGRPFLFDDEAEAEVSCHPEQSGKYAKRIPRGVEGSLPSSDPRLASILPASQFEIRPAPEMASSGISALDALTGGLPRGCLTEICGPASSGRTTVLLAGLAAATRRGEYCALLDASDALDPRSITATGVDLDRLLWVRCGESSPQKALSPRRHRDTEKTNSKAGCPISREPFAREMGISSQTALNFGETNSRAEHCIEQVLRATDLLLEGGGFGLIILDLADLPAESARRIPLTTWFRFRRAVEHKPTILLAIEQQPIAGSCSSLRLQLGNAKTPLATDNKSAAERRQNAAHGASRGFNEENEQAPEGRKKIHDANQFRMTHASGPSHTHLLSGLNITAELIRSRFDRKTARSAAFATKTAWAG